MSVLVDICDTKHLSFSPLNEKHNILYNNSRRSFSQRYKQKPWFRLNPFTDRDVGKGENLDRYDPDFDAGLAPLQSLVIVEDYSNDMPHFSNEFKISEFWDFLFSGSWSNGHAVRVFEGQLMELLVTSLVSLTRGGSVIRNVTKAFAKNKRHKYSVVQTSKKTEAELTPVIETLYLQFIYYGHAVKPACFDSETSVGYPDVTTTTTETTNSSCIRETTDTNSSETDATTSQQIVIIKPPSVPSIGYPCQHPRLARVRASDNTVDQIERERTSIKRFLSHNNEAIIPHPPAIPRGKNYSYTCSNFSNASDDYKALPPRDDLKNFICTEKVSYLGEFSLPEDTGSISSEEEDDDVEDFGQGYYLGDLNGLAPDDVFETTEKKLKKRKEIVKGVREAKKKEIANVKPAKNKIMPEFSELDISKYVKDEERKQIMRMKEFDRVPTLEELAAILEADQRRDAKARAKSNVLKKILLLKCQGIVGKVMPKASRVSANKSNILWAMETAHRKYLLDKLLTARKTKKPPVVSKRTNKIEIPLLYVTTTAGITYLHPVSKQLLIKKRMEEQEKRRKEIKPDMTKRRTSLLPTAQTALVHELQKVRQSPAASVSTTGGMDKRSSGPKFPKIKLVPSAIESPDISDSDENEDDVDPDVFDTKKLNARYSKDRIRKAKVLRKKEERDHQMNTVPHFKKVLKKYFRMQSVLSAFSGKPAKRQRQPSLKAASQTKVKRKKGIPEKELELCIGTQSTKSKQFANVGKLKWFSFLEAAEKASDQSTEPVRAHFETYPMELFVENLERALKEFVVRREMVVSDHNGKTLLSVTFTKKSVFTACKSFSK